MPHCRSRWCVRNVNEVQQPVLYFVYGHNSLAAGDLRPWFIDLGIICIIIFVMDRCVKYYKFNLWQRYQWRGVNRLSCGSDYIQRHKDNSNNMSTLIHFSYILWECANFEYLIASYLLQKNRFLLDEKKLHALTHLNTFLIWQKSFSTARL